MRIILSKEWDEFAFVKENREVLTGAKLNRLKNKIEALGYLITPIVVTEMQATNDLVDLDGNDVHHLDKRYIVIDGQHRLTICKLLDVEAPIVVNPNAKRSDIIAVNNTGNKWRLMDYINYYVELKDNDYMILSGFIERYKSYGVTPSSVTEAFSKVKNGSQPAKEGTYEIDIINGPRVMDACIALKQFFPDTYQHNKTIRMFLTVFKRYPAFDINIIIKLFNENPSLIDRYELKSVPSQDSQMLFDIYAEHFEPVEGRKPTNEMREFLYSYYNNRCNYDGCDNEANNLDHMKPYSKGGLTEISNLQLLCETCNKQKGNHYEDSL